MEIGHCKHGEFNLLAGCPRCIQERRAEAMAGDNPLPTDAQIKAEVEEGIWCAFGQAMETKEQPKEVWRLPRNTTTRN